jgi:hypothetical protein
MTDKNFPKKSIFRYLQKIKFNTKIVIATDWTKMNLKGNVKQYEKTFLKKGIDQLEQNEKEIKIFNQLGNLIEEHYNNNAILYKLYEYNSENKIANSKSFKDEDEILESEYYFYDEKNILRSKWFTSERETGYKNYYDYDFNGNLLTFDQLYTNLDHYTFTFVYYSNGKTKEENVFNRTELIRKRKTKYIKIHSSSITETIELFPPNGFSKKIEIFNHYGDLECLKRYSSLGEFENTFIYNYDKNNNWTEKLEYFRGKLQTITKVKIEYFE